MIRGIIAIISGVMLLAACSTQEIVDITTLPIGDAEQGSRLFEQTINGAPACSSCHQINDEDLVGPGLAGIMQRAASHSEEYASPQEYLYISIVRPSKTIADGYSNMMYAEYKSKLSDQDIADLLAFLSDL